MKYYLTFLLLSISFSSVNAQITVAKNKQWNVLDEKVFSPNICTDLYSFQKDTIINSKEYLQLYVKRDTSSNSNWEALDTYLREDSLNRIYILDDQNETILYDFNLGESDTFQISYELFDCELLVYQVDSIQLFTGEFRKRIRLIRSDDPDPNQPWYGYKDWIQGIGSSTSLSQYYKSCFTDYPFDLLCYFEDDKLIYTKPNNQGCYISPIDEIYQDAQVVIFPNPTNNSFEIKTDSELVTVKIYDLNGQMIKTSSESIIFVDLIPSGFYMTHIETKNGISTRKLIVE